MYITCSQVRARRSAFVLSARVISLCAVQEGVVLAVRQVRSPRVGVQPPRVRLVRQRKRQGRSQSLPLLLRAVTSQSLLSSTERFAGAVTSTTTSRSSSRRSSARRCSRRCAISSAKACTSSASSSSTRQSNWLLRQACRLASSVFKCEFETPAAVSSSSQVDLLPRLQHQEQGGVDAV